MISIAFVSGKGGTGKTVVSIAAGQLLAANGGDVLLVDADLATRGLTHFVAAKLPPNAPGIADAQESPPLPSTLSISTSGTLRVIPAVSLTNLSQRIQSEDNAAKAALDVLSVAGEVGGSDVVIFDCQAGISELLIQILPRVNYVVVVTEADPVSIAAVSDLRIAISDASSGTEIPVYGLVSKVFPGEDAYFQALTDYVTGIRFIGQLPFDSDVRRAFYRRELPLSPEIEGLGPFGLALALALGQIDPALAPESVIDAAESDLVSGRIPSDIENLLKIRDDLEGESRDFARVRQRTLLIAGLQLLAASFAIVITATLGAFKFLSPVSTVVVIVAAVLSVLSAAVILMRFEQRRDDGGQRRKTELLHRIDDRIADYVIATGGRSSKLEELVGDSRPKS